MKRLYIQLTNKEFSILKRTRNVTFGTASYRATIMNLCNSDFVRRLSYIIQTETELRKISVNLGQISRKLDAIDFDINIILSIQDTLYKLIDYFSAETTAINMYDNCTSHDRKEIVVWVSEQEKYIISSIKRILRFRDYRSMILGLCQIAQERISTVDVSFEYSQIKDYGQKINNVARYLNSGISINLDELIKFLSAFLLLIINLSEKISGGNPNVH